MSHKTLLDILSYVLSFVLGLYTGKKLYRYLKKKIS
nr:MAG TPA: Membrane fusion protein p14 fusion protein transmembrane domain [Caudoviricetes sp.]